MKRVMTGALVAAVALAGGISGTAAASGPEQTAPRQTAQRTVPKNQDCRTYSSVTRCGDLQLNEKQRKCVTSSVQLGMTERRAEVECQAFG